MPDGRKELLKEGAVNTDKSVGLSFVSSASDVKYTGTYILN